VLPAIENEEELFAIPISRRIVFWLGGPAANFLCAVAVLSLLAAVSGATSPYALLVEPWIKMVDITGRLLAVIPTIFTQPDKLSGVVGIVAAGKAEMSAGLINTLQFATVLNLNLAVFNLLPIAPLDGGKIFCSLLEKIHPKLARVHTGMAVVGLALLLGLMLYTTVMDVFRQFA
jgi:regulator of sigma E protease